MDTKRVRPYVGGIVLCVVLAGSFLSACAHETRTVHQETVVDDDDLIPPPITTRVVEKETVVKEEHDSIFGAVFDTIGEVLALPFRLVGALIRAIF